MINEWLPAKDAPKDGTKILVFETFGGEYAISNWFETTSISYEPVGDLFRRVETKHEGGWNSNHFDFWMYLPEAPKNNLVDNAA